MDAVVLDSLRQLQWCQPNRGWYDAVVADDHADGGADDEAAAVADGAASADDRALPSKQTVDL